MYFNVSHDTCNCLCVDDCPLGFLIMRSPNLKLTSLSKIWLITLLSVGKGYLHVKFEIELEIGFRGPKGGPKVHLW